MSKNHYVENM